jgi:homoserine O-acetyltransferase
VKEAARIMMTQGVTHLPVISEDVKLEEIAIAWDASEAVALKFTQLEEIMTREVITIGLNDPIERAAKKMNEHSISALPVIDEDQRVIGMITSEESAGW